MKKLLHSWSSQEFLSFLQGLDRRQKLKILLSGAGAILALVFFIWPAWIVRPQIQTRVNALKSQIALAENQLRFEPSLIEEHQQYEKRVQQIREKMFSLEETEGLLSILAEMAKRNQVSLISSQPEENTGAELPTPYKEKYRTYSYKMSLQGGYHALASFVNDIENYPKILRVDELSILGQDENPTIHLVEIRISAFVFRAAKPDLKKN